MKKAIVWLLLFLLVSETHAQLSRYIIQFTDKAATPYTLSNPAAYLSQRSLDRRTRYGIAIDSTDLPVAPRYIDSVRLAGAVTILNVSKWLNQISIQTNDAAALEKIYAFPFVKKVAGIAARQRVENLPLPEKFSQEAKVMAVQNGQNLTADYYNYGNAAAQVNLHSGAFLHNIGLRGQGMIIGMLDAGYNRYTTLKAFDSINANRQVLETWDFVNREASVVEDHQHGMQCLSVIAANIPGQFVGTAPKASFFLYRTEDTRSEYPIEEHNWVCGAERVDSAGGDVISSSLGYSTFDDRSLSHTYAQLDGNTTMAAIGADLAAQKGILVVNSAGNEGGNTWRYIMTPADADSILAVGAVDKNGQVAGFSSYGPSADGQVKPDVVSVGAGTTIQNTNNTIGSGSGTSFAAPNMAGLATCLWQGFPEVNNMKIIAALRQSASNYTTPNDRIGYGIPDVKKALVSLLKEQATATVSISQCKATLQWNSKDVAAMRYQIERKAPGELAYTKIAELPGTGAVFSAQTYQYADALVNLHNGVVSYRIRQIVDTAATTFTADYIVTTNADLNISCAETTADNKRIQLIPNPAFRSVILKMTQPEAIAQLRVVLFDAKGQMVSEQKTAKPAGIAFIPLPVHQLPSGKYYVVIYDGNKKLAAEELIKL